MASRRPLARGSDTALEQLMQEVLSKRELKMENKPFHDLHAEVAVELGIPVAPGHNIKLRRCTAGKIRKVQL